MKKIWCLVLLAVLLTAGICAAKVPGLLGKWTGSWSGYDEGKGYTNLTTSGTINFTVTEQKGRIFNGNLTVNPKNGTKLNEGFAGAIGLDNKTLYLAEFNEGYDLGTIVSDNEIELIYLSDVKNGSVAIDELHRVTA
ncbi:MAG: hypothetical protein WB392_03550 [Methanotrichaceae archaeon]